MSYHSNPTSEAKQLVSVLRALVVSRKTPARLRDLMKDYRVLEGRELDCKRFGYPRLEDFLNSSGEFTTTKIQGEVFVSANFCKDSAHISKMVSKQKLSKKRQSVQLRPPKSSDQSWNKSSYSTSVFKNLKSSPPKLRNPNQSRKGTPVRLDFNEFNDSNNNATKENKNFPDSYKRNQQTSGIKQQSNTKQQDVNNRVNANNNQKPSSSASRPILGQNSNKATTNSSIQNRLQVKNIVENEQVEQSSTFTANVVSNTKASSGNLSDRLQNVRLASPTIQQKSTNTAPTPTKINNQANLKIPSIQDRLKIQKPLDIINPNSALSNKTVIKNQINQVDLSSQQQGTSQPEVTSQKQMTSQHQMTSRQELISNAFEFKTNCDPVKSLAEYCITRNYNSPKYEYLKPKFNNRYQSRVLINGVMYSTYPDDFATQTESKIACAKAAISQIQEELEKQYPICLDSEYEIATKIFEELKNHPHGIFCKNIPDVFKQKHLECLPESWFSIIQSKPQFFSLEKIAGDNLIIFARTKSADSSAASTASAESDIIPDRIALPWEKKYWDLYITHTVSTVEIWARIIGDEYNKQLNSLLDDIELSMLTVQTRPTSISCGQVYLAAVSECWYRVLVQEIDKTSSKCLCFFMDEGEEKWFGMDQLYVCEPKFLRLPAQAIPFSLFGLEDFAENPNAKRHLDTLLARKPLIGEILTKKADYEQQLEDGSEFETKIQVVLYDTSSDEDVNLNPLILNTICDDTPAPELKRYTNVQVTYICENGDVFLQLKNFGPTYVEKLIRQLVESKFKEDHYRVTKADIRNNDNLFLIYDDNNKWYRAAVADTDISNSNQLIMFCVDYGYMKIVDISQVFRLNSLSAALSKFPRQAIKVRLHKLPPIDETVVARIRGLLPPNSQTFIKLVALSTIPQVIIYKRFENDKFFNINEVVYVDYEIESEKTSLDISEAEAVSDIALSFINRPARSPLTVPISPQKSSLPKLMYPDIPAIGEHFNVFVAMAPHPGYFFVLPDNECRKLRDLMKELQEYYRDNDEFIPADVVEVGEAYAVANSDSTYYRVTVEDIYGPGMVHVCYCDFGDVDVVTNDKLRILPGKFRALPKLALVAKLHGIRAKDGDWTTEDCLRFKELTEERRFVSLIKNITSESSRNSQFLEVELIDVQTEDDININQLFINEGRADPVQDGN